MVCIETTAKLDLNINCICVDMSYNTFDAADVVLNVHSDSKEGTSTIKHSQ